MQRSYLGDNQIARILGDASVATDAEDDWAATARRCIAKRKNDDQGGSVAKHLRFGKTKSYMWGVTLHSILEGATGKGSEYFRAAPGERSPDAHRWPYLAVAPDQGADGLCCGFFLRYAKHMNLELRYDPSHGVWRDQESAMRHCRLVSFAYLMLVVYNLAHGPWDANTRFAQLTESASEFLQGASPDDPLLQHYAEDLVAHFAMEGEVGDEDLMQALLARLKEVASGETKGTQVKMCRFANFVDVARSFDQTFTWQTMKVLYLGLQERLVSTASWEALNAKLRRPDDDSGDETKTPMTRSSNSIQSFRDAAKNNVQLAVHLLCDPKTRWRCRLLFRLCEPVRQWHGSQNARLRSSGAMLQCLREEIEHDGIALPLQKTWELPADPEVLSFSGLQTSFNSEHLSRSDGDPCITGEAEIADNAGEYTRFLIAARCARCLYLTSGWTGQQVKLCSEDPLVRQAAARRLLHHQAAFDAAKQRREGVWLRMVKRSMMQLVPTQQLVAMLGGTADVDNRMRRHVECR